MLLDEAEDRLLPRVDEVRPEGVGADAVPCCGALEDLVEREARLAGEGKVGEGVRREVLESVLGGPGAGCGGGTVSGRGQQATEDSKRGAVARPPERRGPEPKRCTLSDLAEAVADEEDEVDEDSVGRALDLKVAEERVGSEEGERLVDDVGLGRVGCVGSLLV